RRTRSIGERTLRTARLDGAVHLALRGAGETIGGAHAARRTLARLRDADQWVRANPCIGAVGEAHDGACVAGAHTRVALAGAGVVITAADHRDRERRRNPKPSHEDNVPGGAGPLAAIPCSSRAADAEH